MQPCSRETLAMNSIVNQSPMSLQEFRNFVQIPNTEIQHELDPSPSHDFFIDQMLSSWPDIIGATTKSPWDIHSAEIKSIDMESPDNQFRFENDLSMTLASMLRQQQISGGDADGTSSAVEAKSFLIQQQLFQSRGGGLMSLESDSGAGVSGVLSIPLRLGSSEDIVDVSSFNSANLGTDGSVQTLYNGLVESLHGTGHTSNYFHPKQEGMIQGENYGVAVAGMNQSLPASGSAGGGAVGQPSRQRIRARRGHATDPHSIAERLRREKIAERMKALQELVPNANKTDKASMLDEIIDYVKFLQFQVKVLGMSRLGCGAAVADISSEEGGDCIQAREGGGSSSNRTQTLISNNNNENMKMTEEKVAKLMEEDMGSAMEYLQRKGLCLMPISLASVISSTISQFKNTVAADLNNPLLRSNGRIAEGGATSSPGTSVLTVQSAT